MEVMKRSSQTITDASFLNACPKIASVGHDIDDLYIGSLFCSKHVIKNVRFVNFLRQFTFFSSQLTFIKRRSRNNI